MTNTADLDKVKSQSRPPTSTQNLRNNDAASSNIESNVEQDKDFLQTLGREKSQTASDSVEKKVNPRNVADRVANASSRVGNNRHFSEVYASNKDIKSELIVEEQAQPKQANKFFANG